MNQWRLVIIAALFAACGSITERKDTNGQADASTLESNNLDATPDVDSGASIPPEMAGRDSGSDDVTTSVEGGTIPSDASNSCGVITTCHACPSNVRVPCGISNGRPWVCCDQTGQLSCDNHVCGTF